MRTRSDGYRILPAPFGNTQYKRVNADIYADELPETGGMKIYFRRQRRSRESKIYMVKYNLFLQYINLTNVL